MATRGWTQQDVNAHRAKFRKGEQMADAFRPLAEMGRPIYIDGRGRCPNATEQEAFAILGLLQCGCIYESRSFDLPGGIAYTPDWVGPDTAVEVKGPWVHSPASIVRFHVARAMHPELTWMLARKLKKGKHGPRWNVEIWPRRI